MSELEIVANGPSSDPVQHFTSWSAYDFIHNRRRNRLTAARARDLVYVFTNGRLVDKISSSEEGFVGWDEEEEMEEDE